MDHALLSILLLSAVGLTGALAMMLPVRLPLPLLQIAAGTAASLAGLKVGFDTELFLLLFIPPLLFVDAYRFPMREFGELRGIIATMALGLVVLSTIVGGYFLHAWVPSIPLAAAMALAAALSPTDAVSVSGLLEGRNVPVRLLHILRGEALLNDASGLVCFKFAAVAATTGLFSLQAASKDFAYVSFGGALIGVAIAWVACRAEFYLLHHGYDNPVSHSLLAVMVPFAVYLAADRVGCSGILAAVSGGMVVRLSGVMAETRIETRTQSRVIWDMIAFTFNGLVFLLLGLQLPSLLQDGYAMAQAQGLSAWAFTGAMLAMQGVLSVIRALWTICSGGVRSLYGKIRHRPAVVPSWRACLLMSVAGTRGAVTLAAALTLPMRPMFPDRTLLVSMAAGVIICSLILASVAVPLILRLMPHSMELDPRQLELDTTRIALGRTAISFLHEEQERLSSDQEMIADLKAARENAIVLLIKEYQDWIHRLDSQTDDSASDRVAIVRSKRIELATRLRVVHVQRTALRDMLRRRQINDETERSVSHGLDVVEQELQLEASVLPKVAS